MAQPCPRRGLMKSFFFSSRRRHTRLQGDWSSDVCSSDLDDRERGAGTRTSPTSAEAQACRPPRRSRRSEEHTSELQSPCNLVCRLLLEKKKKQKNPDRPKYTPTDDSAND